MTALNRLPGLAIALGSLYVPNVIIISIERSVCIVQHVKTRFTSKRQKNVIRVKTEKSYTSTCDKIVV